MAPIPSINSFTRCYYKFTQHLILEHDSSLTRALYLFDWLLFVYCFRFLVVAYVMFANYAVDYYDFRTFDPMLNWFYLHRAEYDSFTIVGALLFAVFIMVSEWLLRRLNVDTPTWRSWYELVVHNQDRYYACKLIPEEIRKINSRKEEQIAHRITRYKLPWFFVGSFPVKYLCRIWARLQVWLSLENLDQEAYFGQPLEALPNLSRKLRSRLVLTLVAGDQFGLGLQIAVGMHSLDQWVWPFIDDVLIIPLSLSFI